MLNFYGLKLNTRDPVYLQATLYVKRMILLGEAASGDRLPSRREIAAQLQINPNTVQKAFKLMEEEGYVRTTGNQGSVIYVDDQIREQIEKELTEELVLDFIRSAREINLTFKRVVDLVSELWEQESSDGKRSEEP
ncbi:GntR family transcriptional regulator [Paenibacillus sp. 598K]|uniref:GntR family transcriptional regulator n=1 Tax=Paenibacillus sp. 598K TaxID=1117987 RepID=UPI000FFA09E9|nr:GntR family transcriptional regulator [Paenibacillus sp. 598K]GBF74369.1 GntR family transcriptional regulator [Paenibacillus sp. 598K]